VTTHPTITSHAGKTPSGTWRCVISAPSRSRERTEPVLRGDGIRRT
jgi:hypothetical protein